jgi:hypothetical protein
MKRAEIATREVNAPRPSRRTWRRAPHGFLVMAAVLGLAVPVLAAASVEWTPAPNMAAARHSPTATFLTGGAGTIKGRVLVAGGYTGSTCTTSAQLFDPNTGAWSTTGALKLGRAFATATDFGDTTGRVLVAGGFTTNAYGQWVSQKTAEIYNPSTGTFSYVTRTVSRKTTQVSMNQYRELFTGTLLPNGKILLAGGIYGGQTTVRTAELFDPKAMTFTYTGSMVTPAGRFGHDAVLITPAPMGSAYYNAADQGKVLVVGGKEHASNGWHSLQTAELYDVATGAFTSIPMLYSRDRPRAAWIPTVGARGMVLVVGGKFDDGTPAGHHDVLPCEWFDPMTNTFSEGPSLKQGRMAHTLTALGDGSFLAAGGWREAEPWSDGSGRIGQTTTSAERFVPSADPNDPFHGAFVSISTMADPRQDHDAVALPAPSGATTPVYRVLVVGGKPNVNGADSYLNRAEVYTLP